MIYIKKEKVIAGNPVDEMKEIEGSHYGIICKTVLKNALALPEEMIFICSVYIPEVYGAYSESQNYPYVEIPFIQDADDNGHEPQIGDLCKVMFEGGKNQTCRLIYYISISQQARELNEDYILRGIISSDVVDKPDNPEDYEQYAGDFLDLAYYITTGHKKAELTYTDFVPCVLGNRKEATSNLSSAKNYFCKALNIPFVSYFTSAIYDTGVPVNASDYYNIINVVLNISESEKLTEIDKFYTDSKYSWDSEAENIRSLYELYNKSKGNIENLEDIIQKMTIACVAYCNPRYSKLLFPSLGEIPFALVNDFSAYPWVDHNYNYAERVWDIYSDSDRDNESYFMAFPKLLYRFRDLCEKEWLNVVSIYKSGINAQMKDTNNIKLKHTIVLCLTLCPWLFYPMTGYNTTVALSEELNASLRNAGLDEKDFRTYSTYISSPEEFSEIRLKLTNLIKSEPQPLNFVKQFRDIAYQVFGDSALYIPSKGLAVNTWDLYKIDEKFNRLKTALPKYLETIV